MPGPIQVEALSHMTVRVSDLSRSIPFYEDVLGLERIFDINLAGGGLDDVTGTRGAAGRMVGFLVPGGVMIELLEFASGPELKAASRRSLGYGNLSLGVRDLDATHDRLVELGIAPKQKPVEVGGVRMFFVTDPDGTSIELIQFPGDGVYTSAGFHGR